jgi:TonB family protein
MMLLTDLALRSSLILAIGLAVHATLVRQSAALRHFALAASIFAAVAVVPLSLWVPEWSVAITSHAASDGSDPTTTTTTPVIANQDAHVSRVSNRTSTISAAFIGALVWAAGCAATGLFLSVGIWRLWGTARRAHVLSDTRWTTISRQVAESHGLRRPVELLLTGESDLLATWGLLRPRVLLPPHAREWSDGRIRIVLCHELAHIKRHDWFVQIAAEAVRIAFWFNPLIWIACTCLRRDSEQACDDVVLGQHIPAREYAGLLLDLARQCRKRTSTWASAVPMARPSTLERRIAAMLNPAINRATPSRQSMVTIVLLLSVITVPTAAFRAAQTSPATLTGSVYDPTGAVMPGVTLTLQNAQEEKLQATSRADGRFDFPQIAPGKYTLSATLPGFRELRQEFELKSARDWDRAITLQVGEVKETINVRDRRISGPVGPSQPQLPKPLRVGGNIRAPMKTVDVKPIYPQTMREAGREGVVPIEAIIGPDGSVASVRVLSADIHPDFAIAAADAVRQWKFTPTLLNGKPVEVVMTVKVQFNLEN